MDFHQLSNKVAKEFFRISEILKHKHQLRKIFKEQLEDGVCSSFNYPAKETENPLAKDNSAMVVKYHQAEYPGSIGHIKMQPIKLQVDYTCNPMDSKLPAFQWEEEDLMETVSRLNAELDMPEKLVHHGGEIYLIPNFKYLHLVKS